MEELDKRAMGTRIRQIRLGAGLRQWELARMLGTTQSAVHKYEHGVVPEPRRLVELARIGQTTLEWVLTGRHWENGSVEQQRLSPELLQTASLLREIRQEDRATVDEALRIVREAMHAVGIPGDPESSAPDAAALVAALREHGDKTQRLLESAWRIQNAVLRQVTEEASRRLHDSAANPDNGGLAD